MVKRNFLIISLRSFIVFLFILIGTGSANGFQAPKEVKLSKIYQELITTTKTSLDFENIIIQDDIYDRQLESDSLNFIQALEVLLLIPIPLDSSGIVSNVKYLSLIDVSADILNFSNLNIDEFIIESSEFEHLNFYTSKFSDYEIYESKVTREVIHENVNFGSYKDYLNRYKKAQIIDCTFDSFFELGSTKLEGELWILDSKFRKGAYIAPVFDGNFTDFYLAGCVFKPVESSIKIEHPEFIPQNFIPRTQLRLNLFGELNQMMVDDNEFLSNGTDQIIYIEGDFDYMSVSGNLFESRFYPACTVAKKFTFLLNEVLDDLIFTDLILQGKNNDLHWKEIKGFKLAATLAVETILTENLEEFELDFSQRDSVFAQTSDVIFIPFRGDKEEDFEDEDFFQGLISSYYRIYKVFKENGQIDDANQTYVEMKDVQLGQLRYNYKTQGGLENWIQWRLNSLLRYYTDYGTNPSRAIRISIFVVLIFSVFYFFFPSEWDTKSKKQLIQDYNILIEKNEYGYFKPFFRLSIGFGKSLVNALTLSLNSFVTLGFGTIPTSGLARYVCIIQGFLGWFLLSVFTASLINQVLF